MLKKRYLLIVILCICALATSMLTGCIKSTEQGTPGGSYVSTTASILDQKYEVAKKLFEEGKYEEAIAAFEALDGYKDSADIISQIIIKQKNATNETPTPEPTPIPTPT